MKKFVLISGMTLVVLFLAGTIQAQSVMNAEKAIQGSTTQASQDNPRGFVDKDGDGVCDHFQNRGNQVKCEKFVDDDGDGICDNCQGKGDRIKGKCCGKGVQKGNCREMKKGCCGKGMGHQHRHGPGHESPKTHSQPEQK